MKLIIASSNENKIKEFAKMLPKVKLEGYKNIKDLGIEENGDTFKANALIKARAVASAAKAAYVMADDSGLCVDALGGAPGVHSARYSESGSDKGNTNKLIKELKALNLDESPAHFVCSLVVISKLGEFCVQGTLSGKVITEKKGDFGFGYDPIFIPEGFDKTLAELGPVVKDKLSHRFEAVKRMKMLLGELA